MWIRCIALAGLLAALGGCAGGPESVARAPHVWNDGVWNSVLGYHGPANSMIVSSGP